MNYYQSPKRNQFTQQRLRTVSNNSRSKRSSSIRRASDHKPSKFKKVVILAIFILIGQFFYFGFFITPAEQSSSTVTFIVEPGEKLTNISTKLKQENIINSKLLFLAYAKKHDLDKKIQSGVFYIPLPQTIPSTLKILQTVPTSDKITIPEGYKISQIDKLLADKGFSAPGDFIYCIQHCQLNNHPLLQELPSSQSPRNLEGFLYPDTYFINKLDFNPENLIIKMLDNFQAKLPQNYSEQLRSLPVTTLYEVITMASIIEREVFQKNEKPIIAGIFWKRLKSDWTLDADAALLYEKDNNSITQTDLQSTSPYNIRKIKGLPPTPISNPSQESIQATLAPINSQYWFYLTTLDTGQVIYATTNDQHNQNKFKYLR